MVKRKQKANNSGKNVLEIIVFIISSLFVSAVVVYLIIMTVNHKTSPPDFSVEFAAEPLNNKNIYHVWLQNNGGETAENVKIELELFRNGESLEKSELEMQFSPQKSKREGWVTFSGDPSPSDSVTARVLSYKKP